MKTYEEAIKKLGKRVKAIRWMCSISGEDGMTEYAELRGSVDMLVFLTGKDEEDIYKDIREAAKQYN